MKAKYLGIALVAISLVAAGCSKTTSTNNQPSNQPSGQSQNEQGSSEGGSEYGQNLGGTSTAPAVQRVNVTMGALNDSKESGTAALTEANGKTTITVSVNGEPKGASQPMHVHAGFCPGVGAVKYPLNNLVNGKSTTILNVSIASILSQLPLAINAHKSAKDLNTYVSCGQINTQQ